MILCEEQIFLCSLLMDKSLTLQDTVGCSQKTYLDRIRLRRQLIENHGNTVVDANKVIAPAVNEFYTWMMGTDLLLRYPMMFQVVQNTDSVPEKQRQPLLTSLTIAETITTSPSPT